MGYLRPFLLSENARAQAEFYAQALGGEIVSVMTHGQAGGTQDEHKDKVIHLCVKVAGDNSIFMADSLEPFSPGTGMLLNVSYKTEKEGGEAFARLAAGGKVRTPFEQRPFGLFYGEVTDSYGVGWMITAEPA
ncbi:VOC family protein [Paenibacillus sp. P26]|nr:VOC family protein [Paenibacillus sp. P26]UUZ92085.1 VOC family protein [Paenibacillus sp. P25]